MVRCRSLCEAPAGDSLKNTSIPDRRAAHVDRRRIHLHLREHEHPSRPVVEPGKRRQSRNPGESDHGQVHRLAQLERRLLFQPLHVAVGFVNLHQRAAQPGVRGRWKLRADCVSDLRHTRAEQQQHLQRIYTYPKGPWIIQPYFQYTNVPTNQKIGIVKGASTTGGAILASYAFKHGFSLPVRWEYISSSGSATDEAVNLLYGPGSAPRRSR